MKHGLNKGPETDTVHSLVLELSGILFDFEFVVKTNLNVVYRGMSIIYNDTRHHIGQNVVKPSLLPLLTFAPGV